MSPADQQVAQYLGGAILVIVGATIGFLVILAIVRWGLDIPRILKNQKETIRVLEEIRNRLGNEH